MTPEGRVKALCVKFFKKHKLPYWSIIPSPYGGSTGISDLVSILPNGIWFCIECKKFGAKKNVTAHQQKFIDIINSNHGLAFVVDRQEDLDYIEQLLKDKGLL